MINVRIAGKNFQIDDQIQEGITILQFLRCHHIFISAPCGGQGRCGNCRVVIDDGVQREVSACQHTLAVNTIIYVDVLKDEIEEKQEDIQVAVDLGTTTICASIYQDGIKKKEVNFDNPLNSFGADVISRADYCRKNGVETLSSIIRNFVCTKLKAYGCVTKLKISGNPIMQHIYAGLSPVSITVAPFLPFTRFESDDILTPCISGYVGGDSVAGIISCNLLQQKGNCLLLDIGTNCEIVLKSENGVYACSSPAGPAFEGGNIECGSNDIDNCIVAVNDDFSYRGNGGRKICGSGIIDLLAVLLNKGYVEESGRLIDYEECVDEHIRGDRFYLNETVYLSYKDIRMLQMAKAALAAGISTLMKTAQIDSLDRIYLSGNFGCNLNLKNAMRIGMIPEIEMDRISSLGNSSLKGTEKILLEDCKKEIKEILEKVQYIELSDSDLFKQEYIDKMSF